MSTSDRRADVDRAAAYWNTHHADPDHGRGNFLDHPLVQAYISLRAFGSMAGHLEVVAAEIRRRSEPGDRIVSVGCGTAQKERALARLIPDRTFVGVDIADEIVVAARQEIADEGLGNVEIVVGDFNQLDWETDSARIVLGLGAIHHIEELEGFWAACARALQPGGTVLAQEYVGPNRLQWTATQCAEGTRALKEIVPPELRPHHSVVEPTPIEAMLAADPSEAVRSEEIVPTCKAAGFTIEGIVGAGCALLQPVLMDQITSYDPQNWEHSLVLARLFAEEDRLMKAGVLGDDFAAFVARPPG